MKKEQKEIVVIRNTPRENPGLIEDVIRDRGIRYRIIDVDDLPGFEFNYDIGAMIVMGGPASANDNTPSMISEISLIKKVLDRGIPYLGICLGLQTLVKAAGGNVVSSPLKETGFRDPDNEYFGVELTEEGVDDPLFDGLGSSFPVFQLHGETVIPAEGMKVLATGKYCVNQIVRKGENAYGIQCHFELTPALLEAWIIEDPDLAQLDAEKVRSDFQILGLEYKNTGLSLCRNFLKIAGY